VLENGRRTPDPHDEEFWYGSSFFFKAFSSAFETFALATCDAIDSAIISSVALSLWLLTWAVESSGSILAFSVISIPLNHILVHGQDKEGSIVFPPTVDCR
jgi:hypothetical protein